MLKEILDRILPEQSSDRYWLLIWAMIFSLVAVVAISVSTSCSLSAYYNRNRPVTPQEDIQNELENWTVHFEKKSPYKK
jgi:hypothetical protein